MSKAMHKALLPGSIVNGQPATLGVMGGGQLGRMFVHAAQAMGYFTAVLDPDAASPAGLVSHHHVQTDYLDEQGLAQLMQRCAAVRPNSKTCLRQRWSRWAHTARWLPTPMPWPLRKTAPPRRLTLCAAVCLWRRTRSSQHPRNWRLWVAICYRAY